MNIKLYSAVMARLRAEALESISVIDTLVTSDSPPLDAAQHVTHHALRLVQHEGAILSLQQYFPPPPMAAPAMANPTGPPVVVTPEMSPTYRKSLEKQKIKESASKKRKKKDE